MSIKLRIRIFESTDGYHSCNDSLDYLDARGPASQNKAAATRQAIDNACRVADREPGDITIINGCVRTARRMGAHANS